MIYKISIYLILFKELNYKIAGKHEIVRIKYECYQITKSIWHISNCLV